MSAARHRLQDPLRRVDLPHNSANQPKSFAPWTPFPRMPTSIIPQLDLSNEFPESPSPAYPSTYHFPPSNHAKSKNIESAQAVRAVSSFGTPRPPQIYSSLPKPKTIGSDQVVHTAAADHPPSRGSDDGLLPKPLLRVNPYNDVVNHQHLPSPTSPKRLSRKPASPATGSFPYASDLPNPQPYPPLALTKPAEHLIPSYFVPGPSPSDIRRSNRHSITPSLADLPEYRSIYSSHMDGHNPVAITSTWDDQYTSYQHASASPSCLPGQLADLSISPTRNESRLPFRNLPDPQISLNPSSASSSRSSQERGESTSLSSISSLSSTPTSNGTWFPPAPPPSPKFFFPGSRSVARPRVWKGKLPAGRTQIFLASSTDARADFERAPISPVVQTPIISSHPDTWFDEGAIVVDDYRRRLATSALQAPPEKFVFPSGRSRAQPKISSRPKSSKSSAYSSRSGEDNQGRSRIIETLFKRKHKAKTPNITPVPNITISNSVASTLESTPSIGKRDSTRSSNESTSTGNQERTRTMKSRRGNSSYPLDPYNSILIDNDRYTGELLSRLNPTGSPSFHDYGTAPPSSVLDLGCGQGHWVLEAAIAWKTHGTHVTGYDMVDISRNLLPWATEQGVRDNIQFVRGNFLKQQLPFSSNTFDFVRMSCLALCITSESWGFLFQEVCRVLVAGGRLELIDDQLFFPYGKVSSLMDDTNSMEGSVTPKLDFVLSPIVSTFSIYGDVVVNPGLGSAVGHRGSDDGDQFDPDGKVEAPLGHKGRISAKISSVQPRVKPCIILSPEAWDRYASISEDLEALFGHMLLDVFDIHQDPSDFILPLMKRIFGQARELETMNLVLAAPNATSKSDHSPQHGLSDCPGLILWPSIFIPMDHTEVEIHASKHLRTLLSCKNFLTQHAIEVAEDERVDEEFVSEALWEYESFLGHRFNPPLTSNEDSYEEADTASVLSFVAESTNEALWEIQSEFREQYAWQPEGPSNLLNSKQATTGGMPSSPVASLSAPGPAASPNELTHVRTFRVYEAVKLDNYILTYDN